MTHDERHGIIASEDEIMTTEAFVGLVIFVLLAAGVFAYARKVQHKNKGGRSSGGSGGGSGGTKTK